MEFNSTKYNQHWQDKLLDELGNFQRGKSRHRPRNDKRLFEGGHHPLVQTGEVKEASLFIQKHKNTYNDFGLKQSKLWSKGTLCITIAANIAETAILGYPMCFPDSVVGFNAYSEESSELFMHYVFTYIRKSIQNSASGSIQDNINIDYLTKLKFKIPLKLYQDKIALILSTIDKKIELNNRINTELEVMAKTLYDYWFVQFDFPISEAQANALGKPELKGKPYKSSGGKMVFNKVLKREIPEGWEVKKLKEFADTGSGGTPLKSNREFYEGGNIPWINSGEVNIPFIVSAKKYITKEGVNNSSAKIFKKGTILMAMYGATAGKISFMDIEACTNQAICAINPKKEYYRTFIKLGLENLYKYLVNLSSGSARDNLSQDKIRELNFIIPEDTLIEKFDVIVNSPIINVLVNLKQNQQLTKLRDWLLPMLMNGQVKVK